MVVGEVLEDELLLVLLLLLLLEGLGEHKLLVGLDGRSVELEELAVPVDVEACDAGVVDVDLAVDAIDEDFGGLVFYEFGFHIGVVDVVADLGYERDGTRKNSWRRYLTLKMMAVAPKRSSLVGMSI